MYLPKVHSAPLSEINIIKQKTNNFKKAYLVLNFNLKKKFFPYPSDWHKKMIWILIVSS